MVRVACTMMQKDESALLEPWLKYHGDLFGYGNLFVFDNGSRVPSVRATLKDGSDQGVHLNTDFNTVSDYGLKGEIITQCIVELQESGNFDIVLPLDCDEFLVLKQSDGATTDRDTIMSHLTALVPGGGTLRVATQFFNIINRPGEFGIGEYLKTINILDGTFISTDHGHHFSSTASALPYRACDFAYVHYHYKPLEMLREHARSKLAPFVDVDNPALIESFSGPGHHLKSYLTMTMAEFLDWHKGDGFYHFTEFSAKLAALGTSIPY